MAGLSAAGGTRAAVDRIKALDVEGLAGLLISPPAYVKPGQAGMVAHFKALAGASPLPIIMYNVPSRTGVDMAPATVIELANA